MNNLWFIAFLITLVAYTLKSRKLRSAEKRVRVAEEREGHFVIMFAYILNKHPGLIQSYFNASIEEVRGENSTMKYGRFTNVDRDEVKQYLESRGFAVYDTEPTDDLREAAFLHETMVEKEQ